MKEELHTMHTHTSGLRHRAKSIALAVGIAAAVPVIGASAASAQPTQTSHFVWTASSSNIDGDVTFIDNGATNGLPGALLYVTPNFSPGGTGGVSDNAAPIAVFYDTGNDEWAIFNEDDSAMQPGQAFNVLAVPAAATDAFQVTATPSNTNGDSVYINNAATNGLPKDVLQATPVYQNAFEDQNIGVWYNDGEWAVYNQNLSAMDTSGNAVFNILVNTADTSGGKTAVQKSSDLNRGGNSTHVDNAVTNGDPNAFVLATPVYNPGDVGGTVDNHPVGVWYQSGQIVVFNEDNHVMASKDAFNLLLFNS
jgi:hypothetical protein